MRRSAFRRRIAACFSAIGFILPESLFSGARVREPTSGLAHKTLGKVKNKKRKRKVPLVASQRHIGGRGGLPKQ